MSRPSLFRGVEEWFRIDAMRPLKKIQVFGWAALLNFLCYGIAHFAAFKKLSVWLFCRFSTMFNWTAVRAPPNTVQRIYAVKKIFRLVGMKLFKNNRTYGWAVCPQTRPSFFHGVENIFRPDVMQLIENNQVYGWAALHNTPCHGPVHFAALKTLFFRLEGMKLSKNYRTYGLAVLPQTRPKFFHGVEKIFSFWCYAAI